jgi:hypothetical protein
VERIEFVRLAASRARLAFERISADSVCPHRCIRVGGGTGDGDGDGARAGDRLAVASTVLAHHACQPSALPIRTPEEDRVLGEEITRQQALIQTENPKAQVSADLTLNLTKAQLLGWLAGHGLDGIDHHGDANVLTTLMSLLDDPDPTQVDRNGKGRGAFGPRPRRQLLVHASAAPRGGQIRGERDAVVLKRVSLPEALRSARVTGWRGVLALLRRTSWCLPTQRRPEGR